MFDPVDALEAAIDKLAVSEGPVDVERIWRLAERVECIKLRAVGEYDRSGDWQADGFVSTASALRAKCQSSQGGARQSIDLARKLESLPHTAAAFAAGGISREHAATIARAYTPERAAMIEGIEGEVVALARLTHPARLRDALQQVTDAFDGDGGGAGDEHHQQLNDLKFAEVGGRGILNGSLDPELAKLADAAFNAEMETLRRPDETRHLSQRRAEAFESMCRRTLDHHDDGTTRRRGQPHLLLVQDIAELTQAHPALVDDIRAETARFGKLSRNTLERLACDCKFARVLTDGPSTVIDVGRTTRNVSPALWNALVVRDQHCQHPNCTRPPSHCEAHHIRYWSRGGPTTLANLKLLCWHHHRRQHHHDNIQRK